MTAAELGDEGVGDPAALGRPVGKKVLRRGDNEEGGEAGELAPPPPHGSAESQSGPELKAEEEVGLLASIEYMLPARIGESWRWCTGSSEVEISFSFSIRCTALFSLDWC